MRIQDSYYPSDSNAMGDFKKSREPSSEKMILKNTKTIVSTIKTLEYKVSILENILRNILEEIRQCRQNEM